jgi:hypothetical protein
MRTRRRLVRWSAAAWLNLVVCAMLSSVPFTLIMIMMIVSLPGENALTLGNAVGFALMSAALIGLVAAVIAPILLLFLHRLLRPESPYFTRGYVIWVVGPAAPFLVLGAVTLVWFPKFGGYPVGHFMVLALCHLCVVIFGGWLFAAGGGLRGLLRDREAAEASDRARLG